MHPISKTSVTFQGVLESTICGDILDLSKFEGAFTIFAVEEVLQPSVLCRISYGSPDLETSMKCLIDNVTSDEPVGSGHEYQRALGQGRIEVLEIYVRHGAQLISR